MRQIRVSKLRRTATVVCAALATLLVTTAPAVAVPAESGGGGGVVTRNPVEIGPVGDVTTIDLRLAVTMLIVAIACAALAATALTLRRQKRAG